MKNLFTEAIGGEMEGSGVYVSAANAKVDWIVVKAICGWGHIKNNESKNEHQKIAAKHASFFLKEALLLNGLYEDGQISLKKKRVYSDRLPTVKGEFFGREIELEILNDAWRNTDGTKVIQFIAAGGTGKTKLLRHWLNTEKNMDRLLAWSFYSQGASEHKQISATPFFNHAFELFGASKVNFVSDEEKGECLAELIRQHRCVLVLDGIEPLQYASKGMRGELKDRAIRQLLKCLAGHNPGLCIITTRIAVHELSDRAGVRSHDLQNLALADGVKLLKSLGVRGGQSYEDEQQQLERAVEEYGHHALALNLLGNATRIYLSGNVLLRKQLPELIDCDGESTSRHAYKVMQSYVHWLTDSVTGVALPELRLLYLLGLFDHPIEEEVLQFLWKSDVQNLTDGNAESQWRNAHASLRDDHLLLSVHDENTSLLDCHPLIREYFGGILKKKYPEENQHAHELLYRYYTQRVQKYQPDTSQEMLPLFNAVAHGCAAGMYQETLREIYWPRIQRNEKYYNLKILRAYSDDLSILGNYFEVPWGNLLPEIPENEQAEILNSASFSLRALGRLNEAATLLNVAATMYSRQENMKEAALNLSNFSELKLILGDVDLAVSSARQSVLYADASGDLLQRMARYASLADALHQAAENDEVESYFIQAERFQKERNPCPYLYSLAGFRYCDFLLEKGEFLEVIQRTEDTLKWVTEKNNGWLLDAALDRITLGRAYLAKFASRTPISETLHQDYFLKSAGSNFDKAILDLRSTGMKDYLPRGLLARAEYFRFVGKFEKSKLDLQELFEIAQPSGMRLHLTDYHLELARVYVAEGDIKTAKVNIKKAENLIAQTGYKRRSLELTDLQNSC